MPYGRVEGSSNGKGFNIHVVRIYNLWHHMPGFLNICINCHWDLAKCSSSSKPLIKTLRRRCSAVHNLCQAGGFAELTILIILYTTAGSDHRGGCWKELWWALGEDAQNMEHHCLKACKWILSLCQGPYRLTWSKSKDSSRGRQQ